MPQANTMFGGSVGGTAPHSQYAQTPTVAASGDATLGFNTPQIDGTPMRVATIITLSVLGLWALRDIAKVKFNVTSG